MIGSGVLNSEQADEREVSVLHWNVQWGGGLFRSPRTWAAQRGEILRQKTDIVILSEAPSAAWIDELVGDLGPGASCARIENEPGRRTTNSAWQFALAGRLAWRQVSHSRTAKG